jgi:hypothetical protein
MLTVRQPAGTGDDVAPVAPTDLVPLAELAGEGFGYDGGPYVRTPRDAVDALAAQLDGEVVSDDLGRRCVSREVARGLFAEREEQALRWSEMQARLDVEAAEVAARNPVWGGIPSGAIPDGVTPAAAILQAAKDAGPRRQSVLEHALANEGVIEYHPVERVPE